jgi:hypothetical protein
MKKEYLNASPVAEVAKIPKNKIEYMKTLANK